MAFGCHPYIITSNSSARISECRIWFCHPFMSTTNHLHHLYGEAEAERKQLVPSLPSELCDEGVIWTWALLFLVWHSKLALHMFHSQSAKVQNSSMWQFTFLVLMEANICLKWVRRWAVGLPGIGAWVWALLTILPPLLVKKALWKPKIYMQIYHICIIYTGF